MIRKYSSVWFFYMLALITTRFWEIRKKKYLREETILENTAVLDSGRKSHDAERKLNDKIQLN